MFNLWCLVKSPFVDGVDFASGIDLYHEEDPLKTKPDV